MDLAQALRIKPGDCLAFSGAGGKTAAIFTLARQLKPPVLVTTTTHLGIKQLDLADQVLLIDQSTDIQGKLSNLKEGVIALIGGKENDRVKGVPEDKLLEIGEIAKVNKIVLLIEADGSRLHPLKAPEDHEPVIPDFVDQVVVVTGLSGLGKPLNERWVHRVDNFSHLSGLTIGEKITIEGLIKVLVDPMGGMKGIPSGARKVCLLNQADNDELQSKASRIASKLGPVYEAVVVASLSQRNMGETINSGEVFAVHERIAGVILAAGGSNRMERVKQLLTWRGETLIKHVTRTALSSGLMPVVVVVGSAGKEIMGELADYPIIIVENLEWATGQSSSLKVGLNALPSGTGGTVFLLADMPKISAPLIQKLLERHAETQAPIVVPLIDGQRGNPVLFDQITYPELEKIEGDSGGRALFSKFPVEWFEWHDSSILLDIDTEDDYQSLLAADE